MAGLDFVPCGQRAPCSGCPFQAGGYKKFTGWGGGAPLLAFVCSSPPPFSGAGEYSPFTGPLGTLLLKIIKSPKLEDKDVFLSFAMRCIAAKERHHESDAMQEACRSCAPLLREDIKKLSPHVVLAMGAGACHVLTGDRNIEALRGTIRDFHGIKVIPTYGIEELINDSGLKRAVWEDIQLAMAALKT